MSTHSALNVAKWFICYNEMSVNDNGGEKLSNLKLQKLLYYAQGCFLAIKGVPLFSDPIEAWQHGPVVPAVYHYYKHFGADGIACEEDDGAYLSEFTEDESELLIEVYNVFGQYSAWKLRNMTHQEAPWKETPSGAVISLDSIRDYFKEEYVS